MTTDKERIRELEQILWATAHDLHYHHKAGSDFTKCSHEPCIVAAKAVVGEPVSRYISPADTTVEEVKRRSIGDSPTSSAPC